MKENMSQTMRIDLIPDVPAAPTAKKKVVISSPSKKKIKLSQESSPVSADTHFQSLLQSVYDAACVTDMSGNIVQVNARAEEKLMYDRESLCSSSILAIISGADATLLETLCQNLENDRFTLIQASCLRGDGEYFPAEIAVNKLDLGEDHLCFFLRDITVRLQREEMLRTTYNAIQNSGNGIAVSDLEEKFEYANPAMARMWGYEDPAQLQGLYVRNVLQDSEELSSMIQLIKDGEPGLIQELLAIRSDGNEFSVQVSVAGNMNSEGVQVGMIFSFVDVSDRKRAEDAERKSEQRRVMLESLGAACHHLGQPATVLLGNLGIIQKKADPEDHILAELIKGSIEAMETMSNILYKLNTVNEYKTTQYLEKPAGEDSEESRILEI